MIYEPRLYALDRPYHCMLFTDVYNSCHDNYFLQNLLSKYAARWSPVFIKLAATCSGLMKNTIST